MRALRWLRLPKVERMAGPSPRAVGKGPAGKRRTSQANQQETTKQKIQWISLPGRCLSPQTAWDLWMPCTHTWISILHAHGS